MKPSTPSQSLDALIGEEERKKEKQGASPQPSYPRTLGRLLRPAWIIQLRQSLDTFSGQANKYSRRGKKIQIFFPY